MGLVVHGWVGTTEYAKSIETRILERKGVGVVGVEAVEGVAIEGVEVGGDVVKSEGPDHRAREELPGSPALANVSSNMNHTVF